MSRICEMIDDDYLIRTAAEFIELRSLLVCRITLFNSRRGGEPARLLLLEWQDAESNVWISDEMVERVYDPLEKVFLGKYHLAYQRGIGSRKMVPILIPVKSLMHSSRWSRLGLSVPLKVKIRTCLRLQSQKMVMQMAGKVYGIPV